MNKYAEDVLNLQTQRRSPKESDLWVKLFYWTVWPFCFGFAANGKNNKNTTTVLLLIINSWKII